MQINRIDIEGFRSFGDRQRVQLPKGSGLVLLVGDNKAEPELGGNGAGKSTLWDALTWSLFGKTARGLRGDNVSSWYGHKRTRVAVGIKIEGTKYKISRTRNPNKLTIEEDGNKRVVTQQELDDLLKLDHSCFLFTTLMAQFNRFFFDMSPTEKLSLFTEILNLSIWLEAADKARKQHKSVTQKADKQRKDLYTLDGEIEGLINEIDRIKDDTKEWEKQREQEQEQLEDKLQDAEDKLSAIEDDLSNVCNKINRHESKISELETKVLKRSDKKQAVSVQIAKLESELSSVDNDIESLRSRKDSFKGEGGRCPTCLRPMNSKAKKQSVKLINQEIDFINGEREELTNRLEDEREALAKVDRLLEKGERELSKLDDHKRSLERKASIIRSKRASAKSSVDSLISRMEDLQDSNPYAKRLKDTEEEHKSALLDRRSLRREIFRVVTKANSYAFWARAFKDVRLWVVEQALLDLEIEVNNALVELGLMDWKVGIEAERENKKGGVTRGFTVNITSPDSPATSVPWESWSGGETQRLRLAGAIGLSSLICRRRGIESRLEVWDEPTEHLSPEGIDDLFACLSERARQEDKQIWVVDHSNYGYGGFDKRYKATKYDGKGTTLGVM